MNTLGQFIPSILVCTFVMNPLIYAEIMMTGISITFNKKNVLLSELVHWLRGLFLMEKHFLETFSACSRDSQFLT